MDTNTTVAATIADVPDPSSDQVTLVVISAGVTDPSSTRMLAERAAQSAMERIRANGQTVTTSIIDLASMAADIGRSVVASEPTPRVLGAIRQVSSADGLIVATPVYKAGISGLFKAFIDVMDADLIVAKPIILAATAGTPRHAMVVDEQLRPLFAFMRAMPVPTSLFAAPEDWANPDLGKHISRAGVEFAELVRARIADKIADGAWSEYQHQFNGHATRSERSADDVNFETDLMRLAAGGRAAEVPRRDER